jgi:hypothetical protein
LALLGLAVQKYFEMNVISIGGFFGGALLTLIGIVVVARPFGWACAHCRKHLEMERIRLAPAHLGHFQQALASGSVDQLASVYHGTPMPPPAQAGQTHPAMLPTAARTCAWNGPW